MLPVMPLRASMPVPSGLRSYRCGMTTTSMPGSMSRRGDDVFLQLPLGGIGALALRDDDGDAFGHDSDFRFGDCSLIDRAMRHLLTRSSVP